MRRKSDIQIFLAHASEDKFQVRTLYKKLKQEGYSPWLDEENLLAGQVWQEEILKAIQESDFLILCLSNQSITKRGYVQKEFRLALNYCAECPPDTIYLISLRLDDCQVPDLRQGEYGIALRDYQWIDYHKPDGFTRLIQAIEHQISLKEISEVDNHSFDDFPTFLLKITFLRFFRTRHAIHQGHTLYLFSQEEIEARGLLGPWLLNFYESILASLPAFIFLRITSIFQSPVIEDEAVRIASEINNSLTPFLFPITFLLSSWAASRFSFYPKDSTETKRKKAKYAYLYFDGAYGLWAQMSVVTIEVILQTFYGTNSVGVLLNAVETFASQGYGIDASSPVGVVGFVASLIGVAAIFWNLRIAFYDIASELFKVNGYSGETPAFFASSKAKPNSGPWLRYQYSIIAFVSIVFFMLNLITGFFSGLLGGVLSAIF